MSHVVHPYSHRLGIIRDWKSRWFNPNRYRDFLRSDILIREFLQKKLRGMYVSGVEIERSEKIFRLIIKTSRPGFIIGKSGEGAQKLKDELLALIVKKNISTNQELKLDIEEVRSPESNAMIVAEMVAEGLEKRMPFRRVVKQMVEKVMANRDVSGVKIILAGRLGGADMARREKILRGRIPLQTFQADIDFARYEANLPYGKIGIKVWICRGEVFHKK